MRRWTYFCFLSILVLTGCSLVPGATVPNSISQGKSLPSLYHLNWGYNYVSDAIWSPNGRWIAAFAGGGPGETHLTVLTPDGRKHYNLSGWPCGLAETFDIAWLPDSRLSCINGVYSGGPSTFCIGSFPFSMCQVTDFPNAFQLTHGAVWSPDGSYAIVAGEAIGPNGDLLMDRLNVLKLNGRVVQAWSPHFPDDIALPKWEPQAAAISYILTPQGTFNQTYPSSLVISTTHWDSATGQVVFGPPREVISEVGLNLDSYSWSPSGNWIALRHEDYNGGDKILLLNPSQPSQRIDVVLADDIGQQMMKPLWSPDGKTLIVFSVAYGASQPYSIDIARFLASKGLQP